jgi:hypothetical protein
MAEHMFKKSLSCKQFFDPNTTESLADILFEMGKDLLDSKQYHMAVKWLERSYEVINGPELDQLSMDAGELRISIMEATIKALLGLKEAAAAEKARGLVLLLGSEIGDKLLVLLLRLELLSAVTTESFDSISYRDILQKMITSIVLSESTFKLIMLHIRKLNDKSPNLACSILDVFLRLRVLISESEQNNWIEKVLITRIWMTVSQRDSPDALASLETILHDIASNLKRPLSSAVTLAAHTVCSFTYVRT